MTKTFLLLLASASAFHYAPRYYTPTRYYSSNYPSYMPRPSYYNDYNHNYSAEERAWNRGLPWGTYQGPYIYNRDCYGRYWGDTYDRYGRYWGDTYDRCGRYWGDRYNRYYQNYGYGY